MPDPCEALRQDFQAAYDEYQRLLVQSEQPGAVDAGEDGFVKIKLLKPDLLAQVQEAKAKLPAAKQAMDRAAERLAECRHVNGVW